MATAPKMPPDEATEILRRLEPAITGISTRLDKIEAEQRRLGDALTKTQVELGELRGRVSQLPTLVQIVGAVLGINAGIIALGFALARLVSR